MIFDRSYIDVINARKVFANTVQNFRELAEPEQRIIDRAFFNLTALNRITAKINEIWGLVVTLGGVKVESADVREWSRQEIFTINNFANIRENIGEILSQIHEWEFVDFQPLQDAYETINDDYSYTNLNTLEKLLFDIYNELEDANIEVDPNCLTFSSPSSFTFEVAGPIEGGRGWSGTLEYSINAQEWNKLGGVGTKLSVDGGVLYLRGKGAVRLTGYSGVSLAVTSYFKITSSNDDAVSISGNIETLLDYRSVANGERPTAVDYTFHHLFMSSGVIDAKKLELPPPMGVGCYGYMFFNCDIIAAPALPAMELTSRCCQYMFQGSTLVTAPSLPATKLAPGCYASMFSMCKNLKHPPELPATELAEDCYAWMFKSCTSLSYSPSLPATKLAKRCYSNMFANSTLVTAPSLPATELAEYCYSEMFYACEELTSIPSLLATKLTPKGCYREMFVFASKVCISASKTDEYATEYKIPEVGDGGTVSDIFGNMFYDTGGTFTGTPTPNTIYYTSNTVV